MKNQTAISPMTAKFDPFAGSAIVRVIHTTQAQEELWTACLIGGKDANRAYNESASLILKGELHIDSLQKALNDLILRHESLRAVFSTDGRYMSILENIPVTLDFHDITGLRSDEKEDFVSSFLKKDANQLFDLVQGPLLRAGLIKIANNEYRLILTAHHIIFDGWSLGILLQELGALYSAHVQEVVRDLPIPESYSTFADTQQTIIESDAYGTIEQFWLGQFERSVPRLTLPTDFPRPSLRTYKSNRLDFTLESDLLSSLKKTGLRAGCSFVTTLLTAFELFLYRQSGQEELIVGLPSAGQSVSGMNQLIGHCVNLLPLRTTIDPDISFTEYLKKRKSALFDAYENQPLSFGHLLQKLAIARDPSRVPLVPVVFNIDLGMSDGVAFNGLTYELISNPRAYEIFEIFLNATGSENSMVLEWSYNTALFKPATITQMMASFEEVLHSLVAKPDGKLSEIAQADLSQYTELNTTDAPYPDLPLHKLLSKQALKTPNRTALKFNGTETSYATLHEQADQLAHYFFEQGVCHGDFIGVCLDRSPELLVTLLAVLKCGAAYVPMDPKYPRKRLQFMLEDSGAKFLMTTKKLSESLPATAEHLLLEDAPYATPLMPVTPLETNVDQKKVAYLLYTSGSTGMPKGVPVTHKNLVNLLSSIAVEPGITKLDRLLSITSISFDIASLELFLPLLKGATLIMADSETARDGRLLLDVLRKENVSILQATPSTWQMLLDAGWKRPLALKAFCGGEALPCDLARQLLIRCSELWNMYGPTETTIYSVIKQIKADDKPITIGRPIANTKLYILDTESFQLAAPGKIGEIAIAGDGVAMGYWRREELTAEKFIENPFRKDNSTKLYRTGDLGRLLLSGDIECLGRVDQQIKIRGHRIEPGEIERALIALDNINAAVVVAKRGSLMAHVVPGKKIDSEGEQVSFWRNALVTRLPAHLLPTEFNILESLPKTLNGKLDRKALAETNSPKTTMPVFTGPRTATEKIVAKVWQECLELEETDIFSNFFELGGHSLIAVRVMVLLEKQTGKRLPLSALFEYSTIEKLATLLDNDTGCAEVSGNSLVPMKTGDNTKTPLYLIHGLGLNVLKFRDLTKKLDEDQPVFGLQGTGFVGKNQTLNTAEEIAAHYIDSILKTNPKGPYALAGHSYGGIISYEMARQLVQKGKKVSKLIMLDTYVEPYFYRSSSLGKKLAGFDFQVQKKLSFLKEMGKSWESFKFQLKLKKEYFLDKYKKSEEHLTLQDQSEYQHLLEIEKMNEKIMWKYNLVPENFEIDLLRANKKLFFVHDPAYLGWKKVALKGLNIHEVPGTHLDMFAPPNDKITAAIVQGILNRKN